MADDPAIIISTACRPVEIPPTPIIGIFMALYKSYTHLTAMGLMASPVTPPTLKLKIGFWASILMIMPGPIELTAVMASAPASSAAFAIVQISGMLGDSLTNTGNFVAFLTSEVISKVA